MTEHSSTMRGVTIGRHGGPEVLELRADLPRPAPAPGEILVRVAATGVNHVDQVVRRGYPGIPVRLPHTLGGDIAGRVAALGEGVEAVKLGERVVGLPAGRRRYVPALSRG